MTGSTYRLTLREGIVGGFVGPTLKKVVEIRGDANSGATVMQMSLKPEAKNDYLTQSGAVSTEQVTSLIGMIKQQLEQLPVEEPFGSEDIYGLDTAIMFSVDDFHWANGGGPEGCTGNQESTRKATPEQKQVFAELVDMITRFGMEHTKSEA
ncbi:hypothetical protein K492DRAFT_178863 [Lichtheimia hyalospora FSU 10163]|nr:hypothetical protein K492DRAFT_178863 [Lichtheimia hyalospora FSU 10163]